MKLASRLHEAEDLEAAIEHCYANKWTDGLPVVPATRGAIERILNYLQRDPREIVGVIPPRNGVATIEKIARVLRVPVWRLLQPGSFPETERQRGKTGSRIKR